VIVGVVMCLQVKVYWLRVTPPASDCT
jgi:hypothetical protein